MPGGRGRQQWLLAGQQLLREGGVPAVKLDALTERTGRTTGSFYHHFSGMSGYLDELARFYGADQVETFLAGIDDEDPMARVRSLVALARDERMQPLDAAMRDWAGNNPAAATAVEAADAALLEFLSRALRELGHAEDEARVRATVLLSVGVARVHPPWRLPPRSLDRMLDVVTGLDGGAAPPAP